MILFVDVYDAHAKPHPWAVAFLYELIQERMTEPEVNISATMPTMEEHRAFLNSLPYRHWYVIENQAQQRIGYVSATRRNEIGIVLKKEFRGHGYGSQALLTFMENYEPLPAVPSERRGRWIANVAPSNHRSHALFMKLGGRVIQQTYEL